MAVLGGKSIRELVGQVTSTKNQQTITVTVESVKTHPLYRKRYTVKKNFYAHDEKSVAKDSDIVKIRQTKPISKTKRWLLVEVVKESEVA